jgi:hypothetical protein
MSRMSRFWRFAAAAAVIGALLLPASSAVASGPIAHKSGAIVNYTSTGKLKVGKRIEIKVVCAVNCNVTSTTVIKGPGFKTTSSVSGALTAGVAGGPFFKPNGPLLKAIKADTGKWRLANTITATDPATGATDTISRTFKLKR